MWAADPSQTADEEGIQLSQKGDWKGAISKFDEATKLNPSNDEAFYHRGYAKDKTGDMNGSIADYSQAVAINPGYCNAYISRGLVRYHLNDLDGALADYNQALAIKPTSQDAHLNRGKLKLDRKDLDGAIDDFTQAMSGLGKPAMACKLRGYAEYEKSFGPDLENNSNYKTKALKDLQRSIEYGINADYPELFIWLIQAAKPGQAAGATRELSDYLSIRPGKPDDWPLPVAHFLCGDLSDEDLLKSADSGDKRMLSNNLCEVYFYTGMKRIYDGDSQGAIPLFQKCLDTKQAKCIEYQIAEIQLKKLTQLPVSVLPPTQ